METSSFITNFIANKGDKQKLGIIIKSTDQEEISEAILEKANEALGFTIWTSVLSLLNDEEKLFEIVKDIFPKLNRDQLSTKVLNDYFSSLCILLSSYSLNFAVKLAYFCENSIQFGDSRAYFFKDVLPCILQILANNDSTLITFDGVTKTSNDYHQMIICGILSKPFKLSILTLIVSMFKEIPLDKLQNELLLGKICDNISNVRQDDISGLSLACFNLALFNRLIIPVLALDTYFYNKRYKNKFVEMDSESDMDSIDEASEKGIIETEENVIFHFQHVTEFTSIEKDIVNALKPLAFAPKFIISPFIATVLVSFAKMSSASVAGNLRLPQSILLPFIKQVFKNNERHRKILHQSAWARSVDQFQPIDIDKLLKILQENTCKRGQNVALNGFIGLTFMLLKTREAPALNTFAIQFLNELVKQRQEFTSDIMKIVVKMLFSEPNKGPIIDCFSHMIQNRSLPIDRCEEALTELIENLTELELDTTLAIESVIYNAITKSMKLRELMTQTMRSAMYQNNPGMRKLAVYSFCVMLKKITKPSQSSSFEAFGPSQNISMMSLMSQSQLPSTEKVNMRRVSVLVLEILGILQKCFSLSADIKITLYESLLSAVAANPFIIPKVLELVESHFRDYFDSEESETVVNFSKVFKQLEHGEIVVMDHLGKFLNFFVGCIEIANEKLLDEGNVQIGNYRSIINKLIDKIVGVSMEQLGVFAFLDIKASATIVQFLNCLEVLMLYCSHNLAGPESVSRITKLFDKHQKVTAEALRLQDSCKKGPKRSKNLTVDAVVAPKVELIIECVWDLKACGSFLEIFFNGGSNPKVESFKENEKLLRFVLKSTSQKILQLSTAPEYLKVKHSKAIFASLKKYSTVLYQQLELESFRKLFEHFGADSAIALTDAFKNTITTMDVIYNSPAKWQEFLQKLTGTANAIDWMIMEVIKTIQKIIDWAFDADKNDIHSDPNVEKVVCNLFIAIESLFRNFQIMPNPYTRDTYNWFVSFCRNNEVKEKSLHIVNKVFFQVMMQQDAGNVMMEHIANKISSIYGFLEELDEPEESLQNNLKSISIATVDQSFHSFAIVVKKQIEDVDFCILRMNSFNAHVKIPGQDTRDESKQALQSMGKSCVIKLQQLGKVVGRLCNTRFRTRGTQVETIGKVAISYFSCLNNLMKHFCQHFDVENIDKKQTNFQLIALETLMKETKNTVKHVYALAPFIEDMLEIERQQAVRDNKKKPVAKEAKYMPRVVLTAEKFFKIVKIFDLQTKKNFSKYIHVGDVRGFRFKSDKKSRKSAVEEASDVDENSAFTMATAADSEQSESDKQMSDSDDEPVVASRAKRSRKNISSSSEDDDEPSVDSDAARSSIEQPLPVRRDGFLKNLNIINKKTTRRNASKR